MKVKRKDYILVYFVAKGTVSLFLGDDYGNKEIKEVKKSNKL